MPLVHKDSLQAIHLELLLAAFHSNESFRIGIGIQHIHTRHIVHQLVRFVVSDLIFNALLTFARYSAQSQRTAIIFLTLCMPFCIE